ncbi:GntR family transcriptional regulator [Sphingomonadaceae bacterium G21617-S1]|nr:GntR family transcriptional regulator [Sphingomonadaceae bacterium G21617-S1]
MADVTGGFATPLEKNGELGAELALASERVANDINRLILSGELRPGSRIRQEELAARFGTSRIPVREALRRLEMNGLITLKANSGAWVAKLDLGECIEVYKIREQIEPLALAESVKRISEEEISALEKLVCAMEESHDVDEFLQLDRDFHLRSYQPAEMMELYGLILRFWNRTQQYRRAFTSFIDMSGRQVINYEHRLILEGIKRRDADGASQLLQGHIRRTRLSLAENPAIFAVQ